MSILPTYGRNFWRQATERAIKTAAQAALLVAGGDAANLIGTNWRVFAGAIGGGYLLSVLTSVATAGAGQQDDPSAIRRTTP
jgi:hypothetical protein